MTKLEVGKEYWFKGRVEEIQEMYRFEPYVVKFENWKSWVPDDVEAVEVIPDREKVTIPNFVADWIEETKRFYNLYGAMGRIKDNLAPSEIMKWFYTNPTLTGEIFARVWLDGYEIEKEPLGVLLVDMPEESLEKYYYLYNSTDGKVAVGSLNRTDLLIKMGIKVTEAEAKEKYPNFKWVSLEELENE